MLSLLRSQQIRLFRQTPLACVTRTNYSHNNNNNNTTNNNNNNNNNNNTHITTFVPFSQTTDEKNSTTTSGNNVTPLTLTAAVTALSGALSTSTVAFAQSTSPTAVAISPALASFLKVAPPACFFFLQVSGLKTVQQIKKDKTTGNLSILPFLSLATNCVVWSLYGALVSDPTVLLPNLSGAAFGFYYTYMYSKYSPKSTLPQLLLASGIIGGTAALALTMPQAEAAPYIGYTGCTLAVILMASPLATMATVLKEKSTAAMPFATSVATFLNASSWAGYGILVAGDPIIWGPNTLGLAAACVQLALFAKFGIHSPNKK